MMRDELYFIVDRTLADVENVTQKGVYNARDLNRVERDCRILNELLTAIGYPSQITTRENWDRKEFPSAAEMERIRCNLTTIRACFFVKEDTPEIPNSLDYMDYKKANDIERILRDLYQVYQVVLSMTPSLNGLYLGGV